MQQLEEAIKAKTSVQFSTSANPASTSGSQKYPLGSREETLTRMNALQQEADAQTKEDPSAAYRSRLEQLQTAGIGGSYSPPRLLQEDDTQPRHREGYEQFANSNSGDRWKLDSQPDAPRTPYELRAGYVIPAIMIYGINSSLPGQIAGQVSQDVYDTATHRWKLIPQGSRLVGTYSSEVEYGQARVLVAWQRIIFPDGKAMDIGTMPGSDSEGYSGFTDQVNNHYVRLYSSAFLLSAMTAGFTLSQNQTNTGQGLGYQQNATTAMSQALGQQLGQVTARLMSKNLNISPTLEIRPGYRFNVVVTKDMTFTKPYQAFDY
jgi:type IV secretion system protein VirB10